MNNEKEFTIGLVQQPCAGDLKTNQDRAEEGIRKAQKQGAQIICLPELFSSPYFCTAEDTRFFDLAESIAGQTVQRFSNLARELGVVIVVPFFERRASGVYHNSAIVLDADGSNLGVYRKMHIPDDPLFFEKYYFAPGDVTETGGFRVFQTKFGVIGVLICWDQWYPEAARITSMLGAQAIFYPTAIGWHPKEKQEFGMKQRSAWQTIQRAHAIANGVYVAAVNRIGFEPTAGTEGLEFFGSSFISDPFGEVLTEGGIEETCVLLAKVNPKHAEDVRRNWPFFRDRRIDAYSCISSRFLEAK